ncbi:11765_t:CDS:2 [Dentiscutata erythropus]|uniref:11765_t:CDS:1 n=1 Tax=Dentiscutata erythropus TaxID=1348616 RepID=A0A9N9I5L1_9GLOM|nr:11765_t:CDS:2 [Dentiscutata erythropus]
MFARSRLLTLPKLNQVNKVKHIYGFHTTAILQSGKVVEATSQSFQKLVLNAKEPVIVDFYADWCGPCKLLAPILHRIVTDNKKVTLVKVNTDENQDLTEKYKITGLPTVYSFHKGKPIEHFIGVKSEGAIKEFVEKAACLAD